MRWYNVGPFLQLLRAFRVVWLKGRFGGGKTLLSFALAEEFLRRGWVRYCLSNIGSVWCDRVEDVFLRDTKLDAFVIVDEAGQFLRSSVQLDNYVAYSRMMNLFLILPSVMPVPVRARFMSVIRVWNMQAFGVPFWLYRCDLNYAGENDKFYFGLWKPREYYGVYDTESFAADDGGMSDTIARFAKENISRKRGDELRSSAIKIPGYSTGTVGVGAGLDASTGAQGSGAQFLPALGDSGRQSAEFLEASESFAESISLFERYSKKRRK
jgi:hypothetical protein